MHNTVSTLAPTNTERKIVVVRVDTQNISREWLDYKTKEWLRPDQAYSSFGAYNGILTKLRDEGKVATKAGHRDVTGKRGNKRKGKQEFLYYDSTDLERELAGKVFARKFEDVPVHELQSALAAFNNSGEMLPAAIKCMMRTAPEAGDNFISSILAPLVKALNKAFGKEAPQALLAISRLKWPERTKLGDRGQKFVLEIPAEESWNAILAHAEECCRLMARNYRIIEGHGKVEEMTLYKPTARSFEYSMEYRLFPKKDRAHEPDYGTVVNF